MVQPKQPVAASQRSATAERKPTAHIVRNSTAAVPSASRSIGRAEELAVKKITTVINQSLELGPTLVVWILDRTPIAQEMVADVAAAAARLLSIVRSPRDFGGRESPAADGDGGIR